MLNVIILPICHPTATRYTLQKKQVSFKQKALVGPPMELDEELSVELLQKEEKEEDIGSASLFMEEFGSDLKSEQRSSSLQGEMLSNLAHSLKIGPTKHIIGGIIKGTLEELAKPNPNLQNARQILEHSMQFCTQTIITFRGDTSHWTTFCAALTKDMTKLAELSKPMNYDPYLRDKFREWKAEYEKLVDLQNKESFARDKVTKLIQERDVMIIEMYSPDTVSVQMDCSIARKILHHEEILGQEIVRFKEIESERKEISERCEKIRRSFVSFDAKMMREIRAQDLLRCVCVALKDLVSKLNNEPNKNEECH